MSFQQLLKDLAAKAGFHVVRNYQNPANTLMGLGDLRVQTVFDVGANSGQFASWLKPRIPDAEFHCFEPTPQAFELLSRWASTQSGVHAVGRALGEQPGEVLMNLHTAHTTSSSMLATSDRCETLYPFTAEQAKVAVQVERLDDYVASLGRPIHPCGLLKIDVQGYEMPVLRGARRTLQDVRACIIEVSLDELYVGQSGFDEIVAAMSQAGLHYAGNFQQMYDTDGHVISLDAVFTRPAGPPMRRQP
jgi:FkbM family methyltransferase